jgi:hypothetical protein
MLLKRAAAFNVCVCVCMGQGAALQAVNFIVEHN